MNFDEKHSSNVLKNQTRLQNSAYTIRKSLIFHILCSLFEQIPSDINRDILKNPTLCGAKNSKNSVHLVIWSHGFPTLSKGTILLSTSSTLHGILFHRVSKK